MAKKTEEFIISKTETVELNFYAIRNQEGRWFRSKGYGGSGNSWVNDISNAKIYGKPGPAKAQVTFWATNYPQYGVPDLVQITTGSCNYLDQKERVAKVNEKKKIADAKRQVSMLENKIHNYILRINFDTKQISQWKEELTKAKSNLDKFTS